MNCFSQQKDSVPALEKVTVQGFKNTNSFTAIAPAQQMDKHVLQQLNSFSVGDATKYFSGVLIKDYGGVGGLKTISVRSLGAAHTGILYDGVPVADMQSGQIDLGRLPVTFLQRISLLNGVFNNMMPARSYASAAVLMTNTTAYLPSLQKNDWRAGVRNGSFGLWQPFAGIGIRLNNRTFINVSAEYTKSKGDYGFTIDNGDTKEKAVRNNSDITSLTSEVNVTSLLKDSAVWRTKAAVFTSERGLPGGIIFYNERTAQRLWNTDAFIQSSYSKQFNTKATFIALAKYNYSYTRYLDPDFLNSDGRLDNTYQQQEGYISAAFAYTINGPLSASASSDIALTNLKSNRKQFAEPTRFSSWTNIGLQYDKKLWKANAYMLYTHIQDKVVLGNTPADRNEFTPAAAFSIKASEQSPFMLRFFYKRIFRQPTFNDLYYTIIGSNSLKPEFTTQYNAGISYAKFINKKISQVNVSIDAYYNAVTDKIIALPNKNLFVWSMLNLGKVHIKGVDFNAEVYGKFSAAWKWFFKSAYTWQQAVDITNKSNSSYKDQIPYTPQHSGSAILQVQYRSWNANYSNIFSGSRYSLGDNNAATYLSGWITHDISVGKIFNLKTCHLTVKSELNNVFNSRYDVIKYFPMPGRSYRVGITISKI